MQNRPARHLSKTVTQQLMKSLAFGLLLGSLLVYNSYSAFAQADTTIVIDKIIDPVEIMPQLLSGGGAAAIVAAVQQRFIYPLEAVRAHAEGRVFVSFIITTAGLVKDAHVVKGFRPDCDSAALEAVQRLPRFKPAQQNGQPVASGMTIPVLVKRRASQHSAK